MKRKKTPIKKKNKIHLGRLFDVLAIPIYIAFCVYFILAVKQYSNFIMFLSIIGAIIIFMIYILTFFKNNKITGFIRKVIMITSCVLLFIASNQFYALDRFLSEISEPQTVETTMQVYALQSHEYFDASVTSIDDLDNKIVAIQTSNDKVSSEYIQTLFDESYENIQYVEYSTYSDMMQDLYFGYIDVAVVNKSATSSLALSYGELDEVFTLLQTYTHSYTLESSNLDISEETFTVLISGSDEAGDASKSDMNMLLIVNPTVKSVTMISLPRDSYIENPAYDYTYDKLTHTGNNGILNTVAAVENTFDIPIDFYAKVSFTSIIEIVDALGGIEVNVPITFCEQDENRSFESSDLICIDAGQQTLDGQQALAYSRHRDSYTNQDLGRNEAQLNVVNGIIDAFIAPDALNKMNAVLEILPQHLITNFNEAQIKSFSQSQLEHLASYTFTSYALTKGVIAQDITASIPGVYTSVVYMDTQDIQAVQTLYEIAKETPNFKQFSFQSDNVFINTFEQ